MSVPLPGFICIGAQKCGTTTLHNILNQHSDICLPPSKEAHFFHLDDEYSKGMSHWMRQHFRNYQGQELVGVVTPEYLYFENSAPRIKQSLPDTKLVVIIRDPVDRAYSNYLMSWRRGIESEKFLDALELEDFRIHNGLFEKINFSYISRGLYAKQISNYLSLFGREQIHIMLFEELVSNPKETIEGLLCFLDLPVPKDLNFSVKSNSATQAKFRLVSKLFYTDNFLKKSLGSVLKSTKLKRRIYNRINTLNSSNQEIPELTIEEKTIAYSRYFKSGIESLEDLLGFDLKEWKL